MNRALAMIAVIMFVFITATKFIHVSFVDILPFAATSGHTPLYNICALVVIGITLWGIFRVFDQNMEDE